MTRYTPVQSPLEKGKRFTKRQWCEGSNAVHLKDTKRPGQSSTRNDRNVKVSEFTVVRKHLVISIKGSYPFCDDWNRTLNFENKWRDLQENTVMSQASMQFGPRDRSNGPWSQTGNRSTRFNDKKCKTTFSTIATSSSVGASPIRACARSTEVHSGRSINKAITSPAAVVRHCNWPCASSNSTNPSGHWRSDKSLLRRHDQRGTGGGNTITLAVGRIRN